MGIIIAILLFSFIIIFHELGHFLLAKANGIRVDEFSLGLGPTLIGKKIGGTFFCIKLLPFGGACMMGEDDADDMSEGSFNSKSVWARMSVIAAGPLFNLLLAWIFCMILVGATGYISTEISAVSDGYSAQEQGLRAGDVIKEINGRNIHIWEDVQLYPLTHPDDALMKSYMNAAAKSTRRRSSRGSWREMHLPCWAYPEAVMSVRAFSEQCSMDSTGWSTG